MLANRRTIKFW